MKRVLAILLSAVLVMALTVGCAAEPQDEPIYQETEQTSEPSVQTEQSNETETPEESEETESTEDNPEERAEEKPEQTTTEKKNDNAAEADILIDDIVGPWHLDDGSLEALNAIFPGTDEFGTGMEVRSDGNISWYIGAEGASGTYKIDGKIITAQVKGESDGASLTVEMTQDDEGNLVMNFRNSTLTWIYGDGITIKGKGED